MEESELSSYSRLFLLANLCIELPYVSDKHVGNES